MSASKQEEIFTCFSNILSDDVITNKAGEIENTASDDLSIYKIRIRERFRFIYPPRQNRQFNYINIKVFYFHSVFISLCLCLPPSAQNKIKKLNKDPEKQNQRNIKSNL